MISVKMFLTLKVIILHKFTLENHIHEEIVFVYTYDNQQLFCYGTG